ncbi:PilZ domain-containing protein [uncultured Gimesia sp.]|uniref:PilZ domain-containing protein n=1 Tax=uncultured Gimesia sp. TaxID=1678688 RepID=UPI0026255246|nr:PilZ domain-containing protein [uncultured Gimesia sp.]
MNIVLDAEQKIESKQDSPKVVSSTQSKPLEPISFRQCFLNSERLLKVQRSRFDCSWNQVLSKVLEKSEEITEGPVKQKEQNSYERREFPRHASEAIVLALDHAGQNHSVERDPLRDKGYVINVSRNGISFASRTQFQLRDELPLHLEDQLVKLTLDVTVSVVRATPLDDQFWRTDCKLLSPLNDQQIIQLKEHASSCYAG